MAHLKYCDSEHAGSWLGDDHAPLVSIQPDTFQQAPDRVGPAKTESGEETNCVNKTIVIMEHREAVHPMSIDTDLI